MVEARRVAPIDRWSVRFFGSLAAIAVGVPAVTFGSLAYWDALTTSEVAQATTCEPETYGIVDNGTRYVVETFTTVGTCTWTVPSGVTQVETLVVGGGGGGGSSFDGPGAGGGGAGGLIHRDSANPVTVVPAAVVSVIVGAGGAGGGGTGPGTGDEKWVVSGSNGGNSSFNGLTANGGGGGGGRRESGNAGGSGGGAGGRDSGLVGGSGTLGQGNAGGSTLNDLSSGAGGGGAGGSGSAGLRASSFYDQQNGGPGGSGLSIAITGSSTTYAPGGKGGDAARSSDGANATSIGGGGGGGDGKDGGNATGTGANGGRGADGIVIVRYEVPESTADRAFDFETTMLNDSVSEYYEADSNVLSLDSDGTIETWVYFDPNENAEYALWGVTRYLYLATWAQNRTIGSRSLDYPIRVGNSWQTSIEMPVRRWAHVAVSWNGTNASLYIDGQLAEATSTFTAPSANSSGASPFRVGATYDEAGLQIPWKVYWDGLIDEVRVWDDVRTQPEIAAAMHTAVSSTDANLAAYWDFNQTATDSVSAIGSVGGTATLTKVGAGDVVSTELAAADTASRSGWTIHEFERSYITTAGGWTVPVGVTAAEVLVVGGGGGGGYDGGGGGGGGGVHFDDGFAMTPSATLAVSVGAGGAGAAMVYESTSPTVVGRSGGDGGSSSLGGTTASGGGGGGGISANGRSESRSAGTADARGGGGGGGAAHDTTKATATTGGTGCGGACNGGTRPAAAYYIPRGAGGGAGGTSAGGDVVGGGSIQASTGGNGAEGRAVAILTTTPDTFGSGGGGGTYDIGARSPASAVSVGGTNAGSGGAWKTDADVLAPTPGIPNRGGGGGGSGRGNQTGAAGGSGIVVVAYPDCAASSVQTVTIGGIEYRYQEFTTPDTDSSDGTHNGDLACAGTWTVPSGVTSVDVLVVAGGGGGGANGAELITGGGGGSGGLRYDTVATTPGDAVPVNVGAGGDGAIWGTDNAGGQGTGSRFGALSTIGGGGGGSRSQSGTSGGSGGGNGYPYGTSTSVGAGTAGQGSNGEYFAEGNTGGNGGGASGSGKAGVASSITGTRATYATGGGPAVNHGTLTVALQAGSGNGGNAGYDYGVADINHGQAGSSGTVIVRWVADPADALPVIDLYARYRAGDYDPTTKIWTDSSGNARHTLASDVTGTPSAATSTAANGSNTTFPIVTGTEGDKVSFPTGVLPSTYTLFHLARYGGSARQQIVTATNTNWLSGFWDGKSGVAYQANGVSTCGSACWITQNSQSVHGTDWVASSDQKQLYRSQSVNRTSCPSCSNVSSVSLSINRPHSTYAVQASDWQVADILVFDRQLTTNEIRSVEAHLGRATAIEMPGIQASGVTAARIDGSGTTATVTWTAPSDVTAAGYTIEQSDDGGTTWSTATVTGTADPSGTTITGLTAGETYRFRVLAAVAEIANEAVSASSAPMTTAAASTTALTWSPSTPDDTQTITLTATVTSAGSPVAGVSVAFDDGSATITGCGAVTTDSAGVATCSWGPVGVASYSVTATATDASIITSSDTQTIAVASGAPGQPTGLAATPSTTGRVNLSWNLPSSGATPTDYRIQYRVTGSDSWFTWSRTTTPPTTRSESVTGLGSGRGYEFRVTALAGATAGTPSAVATATTGIVYVLREFTTPGSLTWTVPAGVSAVDVLAVGGGGGGGGTGSRGGFSGGGGAGGDVDERLGYSVTAGENIPIAVGAGGTGGSNTSNSGVPTEGGTSSFDGSVTAAGGGRGGHSVQSSPYSSDPSRPTGGVRHGGGGGAQAGAHPGAVGTGDFNDGGDGFGSLSGDQAAGGGAGAGGDGIDASSDQSGAGGPGATSVITGSTYGGGGGGGKRYSTGSAGAGGSGGGGSGGSQTHGADGVDGLGGGGGGGGGGTASTAATGGDGGDGVVVIRHTSSPTSTPDLTTASDTGSSSSDDRTGDTTPTFSGTAQFGSTVQLYVDDGTGAVASGSTCAPDATTYVWSCTIGTLIDGEYDVVAVATFSDVSSVSVNEMSGSLPVTIDTSLSIDALAMNDATVLTAYSTTITATGGVGSLTWSISSGSLPNGMTLSTGGTISGTPTTAGDYAFTVTVTDSSPSPVSDSLALTLTVALATQTITFADPADRAWSGSTFTVSPSTDANGLTVTLTSSTTSVCTVSGFTITMLRTGTCTLTASQTGDTRYSAATDVTQSFEIAAAANTITFAPTFPATTYGDDPFSLAGTASSDLPLAYSTSTPAVCSVSGDTSLTNGATNAVVTPVGAGTCEITVAQAGDTRYAAATSVSRSFTIAKAAQSPLAFISASSGVWGDTFTAAVSGGSGTGALAFGATAGTAGCTIDASSGAVTYTSAGTCTITADKAGDTNHLAATQVSQTLTIATAAQTLTFTSTVPANPRPGGTYTLAATTTSGLTPAFTITAGQAAVCTLSGGVVTFLTSGTCTITATQAGDGRFAAATAQTQTITVGSLNQSITITVPDDVDYGTPAVALDAEASSDLTVTVTSADTDVCTVTGLVITPVDIGDCDLTLTQAGDNRYAAASPVTISFRVIPALPSAPTIVSVSAGNANATVGFTAPGFTGGVTLSAYTITATPTSGSAISDTTCTASPCTITGLTNGTAYMLTVTANNTAGAGPASTASPAVTPATRATAVTTLAATPGNGTLRVTWGAPADFGGGTFTRYELRIAADGTAMPASATATVTSSTAGSYTFTGLDNGTGYNVEIVTITSANQTALTGNTATLSSVPVSTPDEPTDLTVNEISPRVIRLTWAEPARDGGAPVTGYAVTITGTDGTTVDCGTITIANGTRTANCTSDLLELSTTYSISVTATNRIGAGPASTATHTTPTFTVPTSPPVTTSSDDTDTCPCVYDTDGNPVPVDIDRTPAGRTPGEITIDVAPSTIALGGGTGSASTGQATTWIDATGRFTAQTPGTIPLDGAGALPGTTVTIFINGVAVGTATVNPDGTWTLDLDLPAGTNGPIDITIVWIDTTGTQRTLTTPITIIATGDAATAPRTPTGGTQLTPDPDTAIAIGPNGERLDAVRTVDPTTGTVTVTIGDTMLNVTAADNGRLDTTGRLVLTHPARVRVTGDNMLPGATATVWIMSNPQRLGTVTVTTDGTIDTTYAIPTGIDPGNHTIQIDTADTDGQPLSIALGLTITSGTLPTTGTDTDTHLAWLTLILALGALVTITSNGNRRRRLDL